MPVSVTMPALGESVSEGTVTRWLKQEGDQVQADEPLLEVSTDKVDTEIPSPASGVLTKIVVNEDETVDVGTELAVIGDSADDGAGTESTGTSDDEPEAASADASAEGSAAGESSDNAGAEDGMGGDQADERVAEAASKEQSEQPSEPEPAPEQAEQATGSGDSKQAPSAGGDAKADGGTAVTMPALGESVTEGTVTRWLKSVGDEIAVDEPLLEVSTDKVDTEIPSPVAGTLLKITVNEDETVAVGAELAMIGSGSTGQADTGPGGDTDAGGDTDTDAGGDTDAGSGPGTDAEKDAGGDTPAEGDSGETAASGAADLEPAASADSKTAAAGTEPDRAAADGAAGAYSTPLVRKLAAEHSVDLSTVTGTGVGGRIRKQDVLAAVKPDEAEPAPEPTAPAAVSTGTAPASGTAGAAAPPAAALRGKTEKLSRLRTVIAKRMVESLQVSAQLTTVVEVDISRIARLRNQVKDDFAAREGVKLSFLPFFALAAVEALKEHPRVNSSVDMDAGTVTYHDSESLGVAVDTERGLLVPVIHDAGDLNLGGIARKIADLADRTRRNKITPDELGGGTFTLTNTGSRGALFDTPIINQPQSAILGTGTVVRRPVVVADDELGEVVAVRSMVYLALSYDHRIIDGADAARFLVSMKERLEGGHFESALGLG